MTNPWKPHLLTPSPSTPWAPIPLMSIAALEDNPRKYYDFVKSFPEDTTFTCSTNLDDVKVKDISNQYLTDDERFVNAGCPSCGMGHFGHLTTYDDRQDYPCPCDTRHEFDPITQTMPTCQWHAASVKERHPWQDTYFEDSWESKNLWVPSYAKSKELESMIKQNNGRSSYDVPTFFEKVSYLINEGEYKGGWREEGYVPMTDVPAEQGGRRYKTFKVLWLNAGPVEQETEEEVKDRLGTIRDFLKRPEIKGQYIVHSNTDKNTSLTLETRDLKEFVDNPDSDIFTLGIRPSSTRYHYYVKPRRLENI